MLTGSATTEELRVNSFTSGAQNRPTIAHSGDDIYIAWDGKGADDNRGLFLAAINGTTTETHVGDSPSLTQRHATLATGADGRLVVGWQERREEGGGWGARAQVYGDDLAEMGSEMHANQTTRGLQAGTAAAILDDHSVVLSWYGRGPGDNRGIFTRMYDANGVAVTDEQLANITTRARQSRPAIASLGSGYVLNWDGYGEADNRGVYSRFVMGGPANNPPMLVEDIPDQTAVTETTFSFDISAFFADPDPGDVLSYSVLETLPSWLTFDGVTGTFLGTPQVTDLGSVSLTVQAADLAGATVSDTFLLSVIDETSEYNLIGAVFGDTNGNGMVDGGEGGIGGVEVALEDNGGTVATTMTDPDGSYAFTVVGGNYTVVVTQPDDSTQTADPDAVFDNQTSVALAADTSGIDFGYNRTPIVTAIPDGNATVDTAFSYSIASFYSDPDGGALSFTSVDPLPTWLSLSTSGTFSGTPSASDLGTVAVMGHRYR